MSTWINDAFFLVVIINGLPFARLLWLIGSAMHNEGLATRLDAEAHVMWAHIEAEKAKLGIPTDAFPNRHEEPPCELAEPS